MSGRDRRALESYLQVLLLHLLKWRYQPLRRQTGQSWAASIREARTRIAVGLLEHPGLHQYVAACLARAWPKARRDASRQTGLPLATFPTVCPWTMVQLGDDDFFPVA